MTVLKYRCSIELLPCPPTAVVACPELLTRILPNDARSGFIEGLGQKV